MSSIVIVGLQDDINAEKQRRFSDEALKQEQAIAKEALIYRALDNLRPFLRECSKAFVDNGVQPDYTTGFMSRKHYWSISQRWLIDENGEFCCGKNLMIFSGSSGAAQRISQPLVTGSKAMWIAANASGSRRDNPGYGYFNVEGDTLMIEVRLNYDDPYRWVSFRDHLKKVVVNRCSL